MPKQLKLSKLANSATSSRSSSVRSTNSKDAKGPTTRSSINPSAELLGALERLIDETAATPVEGMRGSKSEEPTIESLLDKTAVGPTERFEEESVAEVPFNAVAAPRGPLSIPKPPQSAPATAASSARPNHHTAEPAHQTAVPKLQFINPSSASTSHHVRQFYTEMSFLLHHTVASIAHTVGATKGVLLAPSNSSAAGQQRLMMHPSAMVATSMENNVFNASVNSLIYDGNATVASQPGNIGSAFTIDMTPLRPNKVGPGYEYRSAAGGGGTASPIASANYQAAPATNNAVSNDLHAIAAWSCTTQKLSPSSPSSGSASINAIKSFLPHDFVARGDGASTASLAMRLNLVVNCGGSMEPIGAESFTNFQSSVGYRPATAATVASTSIRPALASWSPSSGGGMATAEQLASSRPFTASSKVVDEASLPATRKSLNRSTLYIPIELDARQVWGDVVSDSLSSSPNTSTGLPSGPIAILALIDKRGPCNKKDEGVSTGGWRDFSVQDESLALSCARGALSPLLLRCWNYARQAKVSVEGTGGGGPQPLMNQGNTHRVYTELGARVAQPTTTAAIDTARLRVAFEEEYRPKLLGTDNRTRFVVDFAGKGLLSYPSDSRVSVTLPGEKGFGDTLASSKLDSTVNGNVGEDDGTIATRTHAYVPPAQPQQLKSFKEALITRVGMLLPKEDSPKAALLLADKDILAASAKLETRPTTAATITSGSRLGSATTDPSCGRLSPRERSARDKLPSEDQPAAPMSPVPSLTSAGPSATIPLTVGSKLYDPILTERYIQARTHNSTSVDPTNKKNGVHNRVFHGREQRDLVRFKTVGTATAQPTTHLAILDVIGPHTPLVPLLDYVTRLEHVADAITAGMYSEHVEESTRREAYLKGVLIRATRAEEQNSRLSSRNEALLRENVTKEREIAQLQDDIKSVMLAGAAPANVAVGVSAVKAAMVQAAMNGSSGAQQVANDIQKEKSFGGFSGIGGSIGGRGSRAGGTPTTTGRSSVFSGTSSPVRPAPPTSKAFQCSGDDPNSPHRRQSTVFSSSNSPSGLPLAGRRVSISQLGLGNSTAAIPKSASVSIANASANRRQSSYFGLDSAAPLQSQPRPQQAAFSSPSEQKGDLPSLPEQQPQQAIHASFSGSVASRSQSVAQGSWEEVSPAEGHRTDVDRLMDEFDRKRQKFLDEIGL